MKYSALFALCSLVGTVLSTPTSRAVELPSDFKWLGDVLNSNVFDKSGKSCYNAIAVLTKENLYDLAYNVDTECYYFASDLSYLANEYTRHSVPAGTKPETLDLVLQYIIEAKFESRILPLLDVMTKQDGLLREYFGSIGWTWFRPEDMRATVVKTVQVLDQFVRHNTGTTAFFGASALPKFQAYIESAWTSLSATRGYKPSQGALPVAYEEAVQWDVSEKRRALYATIAAVKAYKDGSGLKTISATGKTLATKVGGWFTNSGNQYLPEPALDLLQYGTAVEGASVAEARLAKYEIPTYQPLLNPLVDALVEKKPLFSKLSDAEKKELNTVIDSIWASWAGRDKRIMDSSATLEAPSYVAALNSGSKIYEGYAKWKA